MPLTKENGGPRLDFRIGMGVRVADQDWKRILNRLIQENQTEINRLLISFGVPLLDENDQPSPRLRSQNNGACDFSSAFSRACWRPGG